MPLTRKYINSPNVSPRYNLPVKRGVIHSTEGILKGSDLGYFFANPSSQVSSHAGIDNQNDNTVWIYAGRDEAAWTAGNANGDSFQVELCCPSGASANWSTAEWKNHPYMLEKCAQWIAEESKYYGLPIKALTNSQAQGGTKGDCQHSNLGAWGGGHYDCGNGFPMQFVLDMATGGTTSSPEIGLLTMSERILNKGAGAKTVMAFPPGATRIRSYSNANANLTLDWIGDNGAHPENGTMTPSYDNAPDWKLPAGVRGAVIKRNDDGTNDVSVAVG